MRIVTFKSVIVKLWIKAMLAKILLEVTGDNAELSAKKLVDANKFFTDFAKIAGVQPQ